MQSHAITSDSAARRHRPKTLTVFAAAFAAGAVLAYGVNRVVDVHVVQVEPQVESEPIFVALRSLPQGAPITVWDVALKDWPKALLPTAALKSDASFEGMVLRHPVREGQPLLSGQLVRDGALLPGATVAAVPTASPPAPVEQFRPAPLAETRGTAATMVAPPAAVEATAPAVTALPAAEPVPVAAITPPPATEVAALVPVLEQPAPQEKPQPEPAADLPAAVAATETAAPVQQPAATDIDAPAALPAAAVVTAPVAVPAVEEPTPVPFDLPTTVAADDVKPLAAPVPALPSTDIERSLSAFGRTQPTADAQPTSVLDRTAESDPPTPSRTAPKQHLVVPERIALAVDASFAQPKPQLQPQPNPQPQATPQQRPASATAAQTPRVAPPTAPQSRSGSRGKPAVAAPASRKASTAPRQPAVRQQASPARGLNAWLPQLSGGRAASAPSSDASPRR